jgi:hypothetical protein
MNAIVVTNNVEPWIPSPGSDREWPELSTRAPHLVVTMRRYLVQLTTFLAPRQRRRRRSHATSVRPLARR